MSTFCRITGKSRGLPKPNYFPLLPPISPADAKRFCRITGKSYGLPGHNYIPVTLICKSKKTKGKCKITNNEASHKFTPEIEARDKRRRHIVLPDYRYVFPVLDGASEEETIMLALLATKDGCAVSYPDKDSRFVYLVSEKRCSLVFPAPLEAAVRDGDVRDVMLSRESDHIVFKLKQGKEVCLDFKIVKPRVDKNSELYEGEGSSAEVFEKKRKRKRPEALNTVKKIFEEKEEEAEEEIMKEIELSEMKKAKIAETLRLNDLEKNGIHQNGKEDEAKEDDIITEEEEREILNDWRRFDPRHSRAETSLVMCSGNWRDLIKPLIEDWDWETFEKEEPTGVPVISTLPRPVPMQAQIVDLGASLPGIVQSQVLGTPSDTAGFEPIPSVAPFKPLIAEPDAEIMEALLKLVDTDVLTKTSCVKKALSTLSEADKVLVAKVNEIPELVAQIENGLVTEIGEDSLKIQGIIVEVGNVKRFVPGQNINTSKGTLFIPGQTLDSPSGPVFVPGFTVKTPGSEEPVLIPGQKVLTVTEESAGNAVPVFVAGQTLTTRGGEKFVAGQTVQTAEGPRFMAGQTVITPDGPKFIPGQLVMEKPADAVAKVVKKNVPGKAAEQITNEPTLEENIHPDTATSHWKFVPGQTVMTSEGPKFVPGQTVASAQGEEIFIAGQSIETVTGDWEFIPGQIVSKAGEVKFLPGQSVMTPKGPKFIPGQIVNTTTGVPQFVPGVTVFEGEKPKFVPGKTINTPKGTKFVEGQLVKNPTGGTTFMPGKTVISQSEDITFSPATKLEETIVEEVIHVPEEGLKPINPCPDIVQSPKVSTTFGHVVQTQHGVEFFPGQGTNGLPAGKIVPGKLERAVDGKVKFVPGTIVKTQQDTEQFVPGQVVMTESGEQFVPGQVVDTSDGAKFVPGQIVETRTGQKFVPGQTMETSEGTKFVPGQVLDTKAGPTFIPGQVISTEKGSKFVPGEVLDTVEGPRFVPGRVVESEDNKVKFVPGQIVETKEGNLRFVAPDLQDTPEGDFEFSVQGFEISPEELQLLRPIHVTPSYIPSSGCDMAIDSRMLRQLSEAGMSLGRQVSLDIPTVDVKPKLQRAKINKVDILKEILSEEHTEEHVMEKLAAILKTEKPENTKDDRKSNTRIDTLESAFKHLSHGNPDFLERVLQKVSEAVDDLQTEKGATQTLQRAIISVVQERSEQRIRDMLQDETNSCEDVDQGGLKGLLLQAMGLARALGMSEVVSGLLEILSDPQSTRVLANDHLTMDILRRLTVMRELAEQQPSLCLALRQLQSDPDVARSDPRLRQLVRESAALMVVPEEDYLPLESSKDIPSVLMCSNNILAVEEFLFSRNKHAAPTLLILKHGIQAIIPRENARGVLTGQIAYTVLDERSIRHFEPLHVLSALRLPRQYAHHFRMYSCPVAKEEETTYTTVTNDGSCEDLSTLDTTTTSQQRATEGSTMNYTRLQGGDDDTTAQSLTSGYNTPTSHPRRTSHDSLSFNHHRSTEGSLTPPSGYSTPNLRTSGSYSGSGDTTPTYRGRSYTTTPSYRRLHSGRTLDSEVYDVFVAKQNFQADEVDAISLKKGDLVEVLDSGTGSVK